MNAKTATDVASQLGRMFGANADRVTELARWIERQTRCEPCLRAANEELLRGLDRFPAPKVVLGAYVAQNTSASHAAHVTTTAAEIRVGTIEAFWRKDAPRTIAAYVDTDALASWIAAEMWGSGVVFPSPASVEAECEAGSMFWITAIARAGTPSDEQIAEMFWAARQAATTPLADLTDEEWAERCERISRAMAWGA